MKGRQIIYIKKSEVPNGSYHCRKAEIETNKKVENGKDKTRINLLVIEILWHCTSCMFGELKLTVEL